MLFSGFKVYDSIFLKRFKKIKAALIVIVFYKFKILRRKRG